jgi:hypothetical protein
MGAPTVTADLSVITGSPWTAVISGLRDAHSVVIEAWGANGALSRIFPRGRDEMKVQLRFIMPGETTVSLMIRDNDLKPVQILEIPVKVMLPGWLRGSSEPQRGFARKLSTRIPPMGVDKPPLVPLEGHQTAPVAGAAPRGERGDITAAAEAIATAGAAWKLHLGGLSNVHSVVVELYGANGGLNRVFPRGRDAMLLELAMAEPGATHVCVSARDAQLRTTETLEFDIDVVPAGMAGAARNSRGGAAAQPRPKSTPVAPMGVAKPPMAALAGHSDRGGAAVPAQRVFGGMDGPIHAIVGEMVRVGFTVPMGGVEASFAGANAELGWFARKAVSPMETISTTARAYTEGQMSITGSIYDANGVVSHEVTHVVQVSPAEAKAAPRASLDTAPPTASTLDLADAMQKSIEERMRARMNRKDS